MNTQEARMAGEDAYYEGKSESTNPFEPHTDHWRSWSAGFYNAFDQDNPEPQ